MKEELTEHTIKLMQLYYSTLAEKERRQYAALESLKLGCGGATLISKVLSIDRKTISLGRKELNEGLRDALPPGRQRKAGGGRKKKLKRILK